MWLITSAKETHDALILCGCTGLGDGKLLNLAARESRRILLTYSHKTCAVSFAIILLVNTFAPSLTHLLHLYITDKR